MIRISRSALRAAGLLLLALPTAAFLPTRVCPAVGVPCALAQRRCLLSALLLPAMLICYQLATVLSSPTDFRFFMNTPMIAPFCPVGLILRPQRQWEAA